MKQGCGSRASSGVERWRSVKTPPIAITARHSGDCRRSPTLANASPGAIGGYDKGKRIARSGGEDHRRYKGVKSETICVDRGLEVVDPSRRGVRSKTDLGGRREREVAGGKR